LFRAILKTAISSLGLLFFISFFLFLLIYFLPGNVTDAMFSRSEAINLAIKEQILRNLGLKDASDRSFVFTWLNLLSWSYWAAGTLLGAILGDLINADTKGLFKGKERKALEVKIKETEAEIADRLDKIPDTLKADGYPDVQVFMRTFREMESVVEQYNRDLAEWEYQVSRKPAAAFKEQHRPPEKQSVLKHLREIQERNKQQPPQRQRKKSIDRDSR